LSTEIGVPDTETRETKDKKDLTDSSWKGIFANIDKPAVVERSQHTPRSPEAEKDQVENKIINSIYRLGRTHTWGCKNCKSSDDKWFMQKHPCREA
jgi:hypothetical protein